MHTPRRPNKPRRVIYSIDELPALIKEEDPGSAVTLRCIRRLINTGAVPHVAVGCKKLVNVDKLLSYLEGGTNNEN